MKMHKKTALLTEGRLTTVADMVIKTKAAADIGADHAILSIYMLEKNLINKAIVTDIIDGPFKRSLKAVQASPYFDKIEVRQGDGLEVIEANEVTTVIIAGLGGDTIVDIISKDWDKSETYKRFVLQPMSRHNILRKTLAQRGWQLNEERLVYENKRFFIILSYTPDNNSYTLSPLQLDIGPMLLNSDYQYKLEYLQYFLQKYERIKNELSNSSSNNEKLLLKEYEAKILELGELINEIS